ncbi:MAG TPA: cellulase family glycosylhydrolase [Chitinophagaceae bacterium]|nr:cellulase family glycosylhydrolase [Chitinophagaceae bacterium]
MKKISKLHILFIVTFFCCSVVIKAQQQFISLYKQNPHYFSYHNKPAVLVTSGEHYGSVLNTDFNYNTYLNTLAADGLNLTRTFSGAYFEPGNAFNISHNTLAPSGNNFLCPWARSSQPGFKNGGNKFDLTKWDDNYFNRLEDFVAAARQRGIIVEFTFFCPFYDDSQWLLSPMKDSNNINGVGNIARTDVYTLDKNGGLLAIQENMVRKIISALKDYDNVMYEICNEPYFGGVTIEWQHHIAQVITYAEKDFPQKHLITQNIANEYKKVDDPFKQVSVFNFHYAWPPVTIAMNYGLNRVIGNNETGFHGNADSTYRMQGWRFMLAGGALYNNLDYSFAPGNEKGNYIYPSTQPGGGSAALRGQLGYLKKYLESFDFAQMKPDSTVVVGQPPAGTAIQVLAQPGKQYAVYIYKQLTNGLRLQVPKGRYNLQWFNTLTGKYSNKQTLQHKGGYLQLAPPPYIEDIALKLVAE